MKFKLSNKATIAALSTIGAFVSMPALAHHPLAGQPMTTFTEGMLSGIGHPVPRL